MLANAQAWWRRRIVFHRFQCQWALVEGTRWGSRESRADGVVALTLAVPAAGRIGACRWAGATWCAWTYSWTINVSWIWRTSWQTTAGTGAARCSLGRQPRCFSTLGAGHGSCASQGVAPCSTTWPYRHKLGATSDRQTISSTDSDTIWWRWLWPREYN